jgi:D-threo-aldose 1-dehydrogenase
VYNSGILAKGPVAGARFNYAPAPQEMLARAGAIEEVCRRHGVALATAALQFAYAHPAVTSICLGARDAGQQARNVELFETAVPEELWDELRAEELIREDAPTP